MKRISQESAFILHHYDWSESSLILDVFTRQFGRVTVVAKGAKKFSSNFRPVLLPLQELSLSYSLHSGSEIGTVKSAEWMGKHTLPKGESLLSAYYCNEVLMQLLAREDAHPQLFDLYRMTIALLARCPSEHKAEVSHILRAFELFALQQLGLLPELNADISGQLLHPAGKYHLLSERGLRKTGHQEAGLLGDQWLSIYQAMQNDHSLTEVIRFMNMWDSQTAQTLRRNLRQVLGHHLPRPLRVRELMQDFANL